MCPLLFGIIGTQMNFKGLPDSIVPKSIAIVVAGELFASKYLVTRLRLQRLRLKCTTAMHRVLKLFASIVPLSSHSQCLIKIRQQSARIVLGVACVCFDSQTITKKISKNIYSIYR